MCAAGIANTTENIDKSIPFSFFLNKFSLSFTTSRCGLKLIGAAGRFRNETSANLKNVYQQSS